MGAPSGCNGLRDSLTALIAASGLHLGFQAVVTVVVYPALASTPPADWDAAHAAHSRRISVLVVALYLVVAAACLAVIVAGPLTAWSIVALAGHTVAAGATAFSAAPTHGRLGRTGPTAHELSRLLLTDRIRLGATAVAFAAAILV